MGDQTDREPGVAVTDRALGFAENIVYAVLAAVLAAAAAVVLVSVGYHLAVDADDGVADAAAAALDGLLLVFILLELLAGVRATMRERKLVAEPFLVVGVIASIKEIVVVSLDAKGKHGPELADAMLEIGVLGAVILALAVATFLIRRKEREPEEG